MLAKLKFKYRLQESSITPLKKISSKHGPTNPMIKNPTPGNAQVSSGLRKAPQWRGCTAAAPFG